MFGPAGIAYVYLVYGMYDCLNVVTGTDSQASAVLIRAVAPLEGLEVMRRDRVAQSMRRRADRPDAASIEAAESGRMARLADHRLASGPGLVAAAFGIDRAWTGTDLCDAGSPLRIEVALEPVDPAMIVATPRIGVAYAGEPWATVPWRLAVADEPAVSGPRPTR